MKTFSFDAETNGLWGTTFAIAAVVREPGKEDITFLGRCPIDEPVNEWVAQNGLPHIEDIPENYNSYEELLQAFMFFYMQHKSDAHVIVHMGMPVEAKLFIDARERNFIGDFDAPYPLIRLRVPPVTFTERILTSH